MTGRKNATDKKVHLIHLLMETNTSRSSTILPKKSSRRARMSTNFYNLVLDSIYGRLGKCLAIFKSSCSTLRYGAKLGATACGLHLGLQRITKTSKKDGDEKTLPKSNRFDGVSTTSENIDRTQRRTQHANLAGLCHISLFKNYVAE